MAKKKKKYNYKKKAKETVDNTKNIVKTSEEKVVEKKKLAPTSSRTNKKDNSNQGDDGMLFGKENFILIALGAVLMIVGLLLMTGGHQDPNEWNADEVYSFRRMIIAPLFILAAIAVELIAIFKKRATS